MPPCARPDIQARVVRVPGRFALWVDDIFLPDIVRLVARLVADGARRNSTVRPALGVLSPPLARALAAALREGGSHAPHRSRLPSAMISEATDGAAPAVNESFSLWERGASASAIPLAASPIAISPGFSDATATMRAAPLLPVPLRPSARGSVAADSTAEKKDDAEALAECCLEPDMRWACVGFPKRVIDVCRRRCRTPERQDTLVPLAVQSKGPAERAIDAS